MVALRLPLRVSHVRPGAPLNANVRRQTLEIAKPDSMTAYTAPISECPVTGHEAHGNAAYGSAKDALQAS